MEHEHSRGDLPNVDAVCTTNADDLCTRRGLYEVVDLTVRNQILVAGILWKEWEFELLAPTC